MTRFIMALFVVLVWTGCSTRNPGSYIQIPPPVLQVAEIPDLAGAASARGAEPRIQPGHVLSVVVLSQGIREIEDPAKRVSSAGTITLPLIGSVMAGGKTLPQLVEALHDQFAEYIVNPMVDVSFAMDDSPGAVSPWGTVTVLGRVNQPGRISIPPTQDLTLSMAIQLAGGLDRSARDTAIRITRRITGGDEMDVMDVNLRSAAVDGLIENDILLQQGDIVYVPQKMF